ncbi:hypothetical protein AB9R79_21035, partial [Vibrio splendidus]
PTRRHTSFPGKSRGLGDVYKRPHHNDCGFLLSIQILPFGGGGRINIRIRGSYFLPDDLLPDYSLPNYFPPD